MAGATDVASRASGSAGFPLPHVVFLLDGFLDDGDRVVAREAGVAVAVPAVVRRLSTESRRMMGSVSDPGVNARSLAIW